MVMESTPDSCSQVVPSTPCLGKKNTSAEVPNISSSDSDNEISSVSQQNLTGSSVFTNISQSQQSLDSSLHSNKVTEDSQSSTVSDLQVVPSVGSASDNGSCTPLSENRVHSSEENELWIDTISHRAEEQARRVSIIKQFLNKSSAK